MQMLPNLVTLGASQILITMVRFDASHYFGVFYREEEYSRTNYSTRKKKQNKLSTKFAEIFLR